MLDTVKEVSAVVASAKQGRAANAPSSEPSVRVVVIACILGALFLSAFWQDLLFSNSGVRDFTGFLVGAKLLGTPRVYEIPANLLVQKAMTGVTNSGIIFVRPPFWALALKPLTFVSYPAAVALWKILLVAALAASCCLFPLVPRRYSALAICCSIPAGNAIAMTNDAPLILLLVTLSLLCWKRDRYALAGVMLGLCLAKFHFLVFLPILLFRREHRAVLAGFSVVASILVAVNFAVQPDWLPLYWKALNMPQSNMNAHAALMPNFYGTFFLTGHASLGVSLGVILVGAALWRARHFHFEVALPLCILGGLLASPHTNDEDAVLAIPALLVMFNRFPRLAIFLLSPLAALSFSAMLPGWGPAIFVCGCLWMLFRFTFDTGETPVAQARIEVLA